MAAEQAVLAWINTFDSLTVKPASLEDLTNGDVFLEVLSEVDHNWFKRTKTPDGGNWVLKFNSIKRLYKLITSYFEEFLGQNISSIGIDGHQLQQIAEGEPELVLKLSHIVIALAVQSENNQRFIAKIQSLSQYDQHELMLAIESIMSTVVPHEGESPTTENVAVPITAKAQMELETANKDLLAQIEQLKAENETLLAAKHEATNTIAELNHTLSEFKSAGNVDFLLRSEIDKLKSELEKSENQRSELESITEKQSLKLAEISKKLETFSRQEDEMQRLKDQLDEFRHAADKLQKSEAMIDKYKKKIDETADLKRSIKLLEEQLQASEDRNAALEDEFRKASGLKPLVESYKQQIAALEEKSSAAQVENTTLSFQFMETKAKLTRYEAEKSRDQDLIQELQERIRDLEFSADYGTKLAAEVSSSEESSAEAEKKSFKIAQLEHELARLRKERTEDSKKLGEIVVLENKLEDTARFKEKLEEDYKRLLESKMTLENELRQIRSSDGNGASPDLLAKLHAAESEIARLRASQGLPAETAPRSSGKPPGASSVEVDQLLKKFEQLRSESASQNARIATLSQERESLQSAQIELKENLQRSERTNSELRAALAALETKGQSSDETTQKLGAATQRLVQLTDQNVHLQESLKKAKEHIINQEKKIRSQQESDQKDTLAEAVQSMQSMLKLKEMEVERCKKEIADTRNAARREQRLIMTAWYDMGMQFQQKMPSARLKAANAAVTSSSWLGQQRQGLGSPSTPRRR
ncbi:hypothetical protein HK105_208576 [Polyrhizophydium stewartii]|uniref:Uncharacterized protein n=1 Tax=Polyrhizophydium stewartii TaxID=2732419 RepID=A0ABR4MXH3_9FUNG